MKFTLVFSGKEHEHLAIGCVFAPCLLWKEGQRTVLIPHPDYPLYKSEDFQHLLRSTAIGEKITNSNREMVLVVHEIGHGTDKCLSSLRADLVDSGFEVTLVRLGQGLSCTRARQ